MKRSWPADSLGAILILVLSMIWVSLAAAEEGSGWVGTWAAAPQAPEPRNVPPAPGIAGSTLRQVVRVSIGGERIRVRFSNAFGREPLTIDEAHVAVSAGAGSIRPETDRLLTFSGSRSVTLPEGAPMISDPLNFRTAPLSSLAISIYVSAAPDDVTAHPGSRTTSYLQRGRHLDAPDLPEGVPFDRWYLINGIEVETKSARGAVAVLGDSITDGRGSTTNRNRRWTDFLAERLLQDGEIGLLNLGIGGNRLLRDGLGPNALARLDRDVLAQSGVCWLIVLEGVNDIGTADPADAEAAKALASRITAAYEQIIVRAHARGIRVFGGTLTPIGQSFYFTPEREAARQAVNNWIRGSGRFDQFIDFDRAVRDPSDPGRLAPKFDSGDHLHLNDAGYRRMAESIEVELIP